MKEVWGNLATYYFRHEYHIYGNQVAHQEVPEGWIGPIPELYVENGNERIAFLSDAQTAELGDAEHRHVALALENEGVDVHLVVINEKSRKNAHKLQASFPEPLAKRIFIPEVETLFRKSHRHHRASPPYFTKRQLRNFALIVVLGVGLVALFNWIHLTEFLLSKMVASVPQDLGGPPQPAWYE